MEAYLYVNFYRDSDDNRYNELVTCYISNIMNPEIDKVFTIVSQAELPFVDAIKERIPEELRGKINLLVQDGRPTYNTYFEYTRFHPHAMNIVANLDIMMDTSSIKRLKEWRWDNYCLALSRWDITTPDLDLKKAEHFDRPDSQDTWIRKGGFPSIAEANFPLGVAGCDNRIGYLLEAHFSMANPSQDIKTYHLHLVDKRNYINQYGQVTERLSPPFKLMQSCRLNEL